MEKAIDESWHRIHSWLEKHANKILANLNAGASDAELSETESQLGIEMPADWRSLYRFHNGMNDDGNLGSLFFSMSLAPLPRVVEEQSLASTADSELVRVKSADRGIQQRDMHNPKWIMLAHDHGDGQLRIDMAPGDAGQTGQVIFTDHAYDTVIRVAPNISTMLSDFANDLERGLYSLNDEALADGNQFLSCAQEIDIVNWWKSPRWKHLEQ